MISYRPLRETMKKKGISTYTLRFKLGISGETVHRLQNDKPVNTTTLNDLCKLLDCRLDEVAIYVKSEI